MPGLSKVSPDCSGRTQEYHKVPSTKRWSQYFVSLSHSGPMSIICHDAPCADTSPQTQSHFLGTARPQVSLCCTTLSCSQATEEGSLPFSHTPEGTVRQIYNPKREILGIPNTEGLCEIHILSFCLQSLSLRIRCKAGETGWQRKISVRKTKCFSLNSFHSHSPSLLSISPLEFVSQAQPIKGFVFKVKLSVKFDRKH